MRVYARAMCMCVCACVYGCVEEEKRQLRRVNNVNCINNNSSNEDCRYRCTVNVTVEMTLGHPSLLYGRVARGRCFVPVPI